MDLLAFSFGVCFVRNSLGAANIYTYLVEGAPTYPVIARHLLPGQHFLLHPQLGFLWLSLSQSLVREAVCLSSSQWCCSVVPMATALGVLPSLRNHPEPVPALSRTLLEVPV